MKNAHDILEKLAVDQKFAKYRFTWSETERRFSTLSEASRFFIEVMLNQGARYEEIAAAAEHFVSTHFPKESIWDDIAATPLDSLASICQRGYNNKAYARRFLYNHFHKYLKENAKIIVDKYHSDPRTIWNVAAKDVELIYHMLKAFHGIGDALAKIAQATLVRKYGLAGGTQSKQYLKIKPDIHVNRVLYRMGLAEKETAKSAIRCVEEAGVSSQADLDAVLVNAGRKYCRKSEPLCDECYLNIYCKKNLE